MNNLNFQGLHVANAKGVVKSSGIFSNNKKVSLDFYKLTPNDEDFVSDLGCNWRL